MSSIVRGHAKITFESLKATKWRSTLTMLGIIIGIVSVVTVVGIGEGVKREVAQQINQFGKDLITVRPGREAAESRKLTSTDLLFGLNSISGLTEADLHTIQKADHVRLAAPLSVVPGTISASNKKIQNSLVLATNSSLPEALNQKVRYGEFFDETAQTDVHPAVIGRDVAYSLFSDAVPLGKSFTFRGETFNVRGIFDEFKGTPLSPTANFNSAIFIPYKLGERLTGNGSQMYAILAKPDMSQNTAAAIASITQKVQAAHGGERDFTVLDQDQNLAASSNVLNLLTTMIAAVAAISLLVGGVGIMNIMLATVTERMHEIGVRKAIGATNRQILNQFVLESAVLSFIGGIVGVAVSLLAVLALRVYTNLEPVVSWQAVAVAVGVSLLIGLVFGTAPAVKAARKDPIEALRHE